MFKYYCVLQYIMVSNFELRLLSLEKQVKLLKKDGVKPEEIINKISKQETTKRTGNLIQEAYQKINDAIYDAKEKGNYAIIHNLMSLKKDVPLKYAVTRDSMLELNEKLNILVR